MGTDDKKLIELQKEVDRLRREIELLRVSSKESVSLLDDVVDSDTFFNLALELFCIADTNGNFIKLNHAWESVLGYSIQELQDKRFLDFVHPDDIEITLSAVESLVKQQKVLSFTNRYRSKAGEWKYIEWFSYPYGKNIIAVAHDITQRMQLELQLMKKNEELQLSEKKISERERNYRKIYNSTSDAIFIHDAKTGDIVDVNDSMLRMYGFSSRDQVANLDMAELSAVEDESTSQRAREMIHEALATNTNTFEWYAKKRSGEKFWVEVSLRNTTLDGKKRVIATVRDISDRKKSEEKIKQAHQTYKDILDSVTEAIYIQDKVGKFLFVNKTAEKFYGYPREYFVGKTPDFLSAPNKNNLPSVVKTIQDAYKGTPGRFEFWGLRKDGTVFPKEVSVSPGFYFGQKVIIAVARDISERIQSEERLKLSEERQSLVISASEMGIWDWNLQTNMVYFSTQWKRQLGYEDHELKNEFKTWQDLLHPDDYPIMNQAVKNYLDSPTEFFRAEFRLKHKNGNYVWIYNNALCVKDDKGKVLRFLGTHTNITERKNAELQIKDKTEQIEAQNEEYKQLNEELLLAKESIGDSEKKFRSLVENSFDGIYLLEDRQFTYVNPRFQEISGYSYAEITSSNFDFNVLLSPKSKKFVEDRYAARVDGHSLASRYEITIITKSGDVKSVELSTMALEGEGKPFIMGIMKDVTLRRKMEREISHRTKFQKLLLNLGASFINIPSKNIDKEINNSLAEIGAFSNVDRAYIFTYKFNKGTMSNTYEWCSEGVLPEIQNLQNLPNNLVPDWVEAHVNGRIIHIPDVDQLDSNDPVKQILMLQNVQSLITIPMMHNGQCIGYVGFDSVNQKTSWAESEVSLLRLFSELLVNVQVKADYERSLRKAKNLAELKQMEIRNIIDYSPVGIVLISTDGNILDVNQSAVEMLGSPSVEATRKINVQYVKGLADIGFSKYFEKCQETKSMVYNESKYTSVWGKELYVKYYLVPIIINGQVESILANIEDISEIKAVEEKLIALKERAEESDRLKSAFLANMSHEIRTPMNAICGFANLLSDRSIGLDQKDEFLDIIKINSQQLLGIINDIIDISKIESGRVTVSNIKFPLNEIINELVLVFTQTAKINNIEFRYSKGLSDSKSIIISDDLKIKQVLNNIISNAIKFTPSGYVEFGYNLKGEFLHFYVKDTGVGIPEDKHQVVFERFQQVDNDISHSRKGTGLGLPISKAFVEMLGGKIWFTSKEGEGSTFHFTIPYIPESESYKGKAAGGDYSYEWEGATILIAEDDHPNFLYLKHAIMPTKANLIRAYNGEEVLEICEKHKVDVILMDVKMPIMDGIQAARELRNRNKTMPIIAQTAYAFAEDKEKTIESGCNYFFSKPIELRELLGVINQLLSNLKNS